MQKVHIKFTIPGEIHSIISWKLIINSGIIVSTWKGNIKLAVYYPEWNINYAIGNKPLP